MDRATFLNALEGFFTPRRLPPAPRDEKLLAAGRTLTLADGDMVATAWGQGPRVLLAHGWESRRTHWMSFIEPLTQAGLEVIAVDAPAHGESPGEQTHVVAYADALRRAGETLGPLAAIVGHSWGAAASLIALDRGLAAERVAVISSPASLMTFAAGWQQQRGIPDPLMAEFIALAAERIGTSLPELDLCAMARRSRARGLVIHDRRDEEIPLAEGERLAAAWPSAQARWTDRYGHRRILLAKEVVRTVTEFLRPAGSYLA